MIVSEPCKCGKLLIFDSKEEAMDYANKKRINRSRVRFSHSYRCEIVPTNWHLSSTARYGKTRLNILEEELHREVATMRENIISYMEFWYEKSKKYKFHTREIAEAIHKKSPATAHTTVAAELSKMKKLGLVVGLDESVPDIRGAKYFVLAKHLDEVTKPKTKPNETKTNETKVGKKTVAVETRKPSELTPAVNPFDKVNSQLGEILSKLNGMANGYAVIAEALSKGTPVANKDISLKLDELKAIASSHVTVDGDKLADVINSRLGNLKLEDSFIYRVRDDFDNRLIKTEDMVADVFKSFEFLLKQVNPPTNFGSLSDEEKYRLGMRDGIKLAAEMGIILPDA